MSAHNRLTRPADHAARFDSDMLESLRRRLPEYLAGVGLELRRQGSRLVCRCPQHEDRSPSFAVFGADHEVCGCHPCGFIGDAFEVSKWLGRSGDFPGAVRDVGAVLGVTTAGSYSKTVTVPPRRKKAPPEPFTLTAAERETINLARLRFSDAFHSGDPIIDDIAGSLGLDRETLRWATFGESGLGLANGPHGKPYWLCYRFPHGLKWRNPNTKAKVRFLWICGKSFAPWRLEWVTSKTQTVYLTEGESDCLAIMETGIESDGTSVVVAAPGTSFPPEWAPLFDGKRVVLCHDLNPPGIAAATKVAGILRGHATEILRWKGIKS